MHGKYGERKYALVISRGLFDPQQLSLDPLQGVGPSARNMAVDLVHNDYKVLVLADTPMALSESAFPDSDADEQMYADAAVAAVDTGSLQWRQEPSGHANILEAIDALALMHPQCAPERDELVVYVCSHGLLNDNGSYGAAFADTRCYQRTVINDDGTVDEDLYYEGAYTVDQLHDDLQVDTSDRWGRILLILDTCHSGGAVDKQCASLRARGTSIPQLRAHQSHGSCHCLASVPRAFFGYCHCTGTIMHTALRNAWLRPAWNGSAFVRAKEGPALWATIGCLADKVDELMSDALAVDGGESTDENVRNDFVAFRMTSILGRLPWREHENTGEFVVVNHDYTEFDKLAMVPALPMSTLEREEDLANIKERLEKEAIVVLSASGTMLKTALAVEYARRNAHLYQYVFWLDGTNSQSLSESFDAVVQYLSLAVGDVVGAGTRVDALEKWLLCERRWLMVIDGCDEIAEKMHALFSSAGKMLSTCEQEVTDLLETKAPLKVAPFTGGEAVEYLRSLLAGGPEEELKSMVAQVDQQAISLTKMVSQAAPSSAQMCVRGALEDPRGDATVKKKLVGLLGLFAGFEVHMDVVRLLVTGDGEQAKRAKGEGVVEIALGLLHHYKVVHTLSRVAVLLPQSRRDECLASAFENDEEMRCAVELAAVVLQGQIDDAEKVRRDEEWSRRVGTEGMRLMVTLCAGDIVSMDGEDEAVVWLGIRLSRMWRTLKNLSAALLAAACACRCIADQNSLLAAEALTELGNVFMALDDDTFAAESYKSAVEICTARLGDDLNIVGATTYGCRCENICRRTGRLERAIVGTYENTPDCQAQSPGAANASRTDATTINALSLRLALILFQCLLSDSRPHSMTALDLHVVATTEVPQNALEPGREERPPELEPNLLLEGTRGGAEEAHSHSINSGAQSRPVPPNFNVLSTRRVAAYSSFMVFVTAAVLARVWR